MKHVLALPLLLAIAASLPLSGAQGQSRDFSTIEVKPTDLGHGLTALIGNGAYAGGNITVAVGTDGIILVDAGYAQMHGKIRAAIANLSPLPVKYVINTHFHEDHTGGNEDFAREGAILVAHENVAKFLAHPPMRANGQLAPSPKIAIPSQTYSGQGTEVKIPGQVAELAHTEATHTDGDTAVFWPAANVISAGDLLDSGFYPHITPEGGGGGIDGVIAGANFLIAHSDARTKIVPGHGEVVNKAVVIAFRKMLVTARARIAKAKAKGMSEQQVSDAHLLADLDAKWAFPGTTQAKDFSIAVYRSIK